jgi:hypothetical protein
MMAGDHFRPFSPRPKNGFVGGENGFVETR